MSDEQRTATQKVVDECKALLAYWQDVKARAKSDARRNYAQMAMDRIEKTRSEYALQLGGK